MKRNSRLLLFLIGLLSQTQISFIGSIGISELLIFLVAPLVFFLDYNRLRVDGFLPFVWLALSCCLTCVLSSGINNTPLIFVIKGIAHPYSLFALVVVFHRLLRNNYKSLKWFLIGACLSRLISMYIFRGAGEEELDKDVLAVGNAARAVLGLPVSAFYFDLPIPMSALLVVGSGIVYAFFSASSGRSAAATTLMSALLICLGGKSRVRLVKMGRHIGMLVVALLIAAFFLKTGYAYAARNGMLGASAERKYYEQTRAGDGLLQMLMAGRIYWQKFGAKDDYINYIEHVKRQVASQGYFYRRIPAHSYIAMFWIYYGLVGLLIWIYVLWLFFMYLRKYAASLPHWYGYLSIALPFATWNIFFSPFAGRPHAAMYITCILFTKALFEKRLSTPVEILKEMDKYA